MKLKNLLIVLIFVLVFPGCVGLRQNMEKDRFLAKDITITGEIMAYPHKTVFAEGTWTFNPDKIIPDSRDTEKRCRPVSISSPVFGENKELQLTMFALKCGDNGLYYSFQCRYYDVDIKFIVNHDNLKKIDVFRIQLDHSKDEFNLETPEGEKGLIYFQGKILKDKD